MEDGSNWVCPYCGHAQVISDKRHDTRWQRLYVAGWVEGDPGTVMEAIVCANEACRQMTLHLYLFERQELTSSFGVKRHVKDWQLLPASLAKPQPLCVPEPLRNDYYEACAIRDLSPKSSATAIRRCLQGMIRDFCDISRKRLYDEISELKRRIEKGEAPPGVQADTVDAIDAVRRIGNIGAHMEQDINLIIDVDPNEAQTLIELVEMLFAEWYVEREARQKRIANITGMADAKKAIQEQKKLPPAEAAGGDPASA